jgi:hypothetical protein
VAFFFPKGKILVCAAFPKKNGAVANAGGTAGFRWEKQKNKKRKKLLFLFFCFFVFPTPRGWW